jgi:hypothetical protein
MPMLLPSPRIRRHAKAKRKSLKSCLEMVVDIDSPRKLVLIEMAQARLRLADQAERNQQNDVVYETPRLELETRRQSLRRGNLR